MLSPHCKWQHKVASDPQLQLAHTCTRPVLQAWDAAARAWASLAPSGGTLGPTLAQAARLPAAMAWAALPQQRWARLGPSWWAGRAMSSHRIATCAPRCGCGLAGSHAVFMPGWLFEARVLVPAVTAKHGRGLSFARRVCYCKVGVASATAVATVAAAAGCCWLWDRVCTAGCWPQLRPYSPLTFWLRATTR